MGTKEKPLNAENDNRTQGDLLLGAPAIAKFLGLTQRQVYRLVTDKIIPSFKAGGTLAARRSSSQKWMDDAEVAA
jgi:predicted DNA-binding transcriptional regulator AlpA